MTMPKRIRVEQEYICYDVAQGLAEALRRCPPDKPQMTDAQFREAVNIWWRLHARPALSALDTEGGVSDDGPRDAKCYRDDVVQGLATALRGMLAHSCVADAGADMKDPEDHAAELAALSALAAFDAGEG